MSTRFAKIVFWIAAIWGFLILTPLYFLFDTIGRPGSAANHASRFLLRLRRRGPSMASRVLGDR